MKEMENINLNYRKITLIDQDINQKIKLLIIS